MTTLQIQTRESGGVTILDLEGKILVGESSELLHAAVRDHLAAGARKLVLHLSSVTYIDSSGVGQLVGALTAARKAGCELRLAGLTPKVRDLMTMTNLNKLFDLDLSQEAAVAALKG